MSRRSPAHLCGAALPECLAPGGFLLLAAAAAVGFVVPPLGGLRAAGPPKGGTTNPRLRRPAALVLTDDGKSLLVANHRSGTVSVIDTATLRPVGETDVGRHLADL